MKDILGNNGKLTLLGGPCVIESESSVMHIAERISKITEKLGIDYYFKASFDKANRTSIKSFRGPGLKEGLSILSKIKSEFGLKLVTDIHEPWQAEEVAEIVDILQIPAFLCRQTDLLVAAAKTDKIINVKKAQFLAPWDMKSVVEKLVESGNDKIILCERGTTFGYNTLVVDMTSLLEMQKLGCPVCFDATHSVQKPGGNGTSTGGNREYVEYLARAAAAIGISIFFMEIHPDPDHALSDGPNMVSLDKLEETLTHIKLIHDIAKTF